MFLLLDLGLHKTLPKGKNLILPYNCRIIFGDSIDFDSFDLEDIIKNAEKAINKVKSLINTPLFYIYDDGTVEKRIVIE